MDPNEIKKTVKEYILKEFLPGESPDELEYSTPLITGGILDSLASLKLVSYLEEEYDIKTEAHEVSVDSMNTIDDIADFVQEKRKAASA